MSEPTHEPKPPRVDLMELLELAWGLIANANESDWDKALPVWRSAAIRWRDDYFALLDRSAQAPHDESVPILPSSPRTVDAPGPEVSAGSDGTLLREASDRALAMIGDMLEAGSLTKSDPHVAKVYARSVEKQLRAALRAEPVRPALVADVIEKARRLQVMRDEEAMFASTERDWIQQAHAVCDSIVALDAADRKEPRT